MSPESERPLARVPVRSGRPDAAPGQRLFGRVRGLLSARRIRREVDEEIAFHLELRERELSEKGTGEREAREEALRRFGDLEATRASCVRSDLRRERRMERRELLLEVWRDTSLALRQLARRPAFTAAAVVTLAVGAGATTTIFSAADHVLFRPLPYRDVERVVTLWETDRAAGGGREEVAAGNFLDWQARSGAFEALALAEPFGFDLTGDESPPEPVRAWLVTEGWFEALGLELRLGRPFLPEEYLPDGPFVVVLPHALWQTRYGGDPGVVGRTIELDRTSATVVGVLPPGLEYPGRGVWAPKRWRVSEAYDERAERTSNYWQVAGRLAPEVSLADARRDLDAVAAAVAADHPETNAGRGVELLPLREHVLGDVRTPLLVLLGAVAFVLLIACTNVASLLLTRASERDRELAVRSALGAGRARLGRQLLTESLVLALVGGGAGLALAAGGVRVLSRAAPPDLPRLDALALDGRILAFAVGLTLLTTLLFGLAPALLSSRAAAASQLGGGGRSATGRPRRSRLLGALVVGEVALAVVLLVGAGLLGRSFVRLTSNDLGFVAERRAAVQLFLWDLYPAAEEREQVVRELQERMEALPGVQQVALASALPFHPTQIDPQDALVVEGRATPAGQRPPSVYTLVASPSYFELLGVPLLRGRHFTPEDRTESPRVALVNETLARLHFPGEDPVGQSVTIGVMSRPEAREIVGVVGDVRPTGFDADPRPELYVPWAQSRTGSVTLVARTEAAPRLVLPALRQVVAEVNPRQAVYHAAAVEDLLAATLVPRRFNLLLLGALSLVALLLAAVGIYGLMSYLTARRTAEMGLRMALGAGSGKVVRMVVMQGLRLALPGVALGLVGALLLTRFLDRLLYQVTPNDPRTFAQLALVMLVVALAATYLPARRAAAADPSEALRGE